MADLQSPKDRITLRNGYGIPCLGFGTWKMPDGEVGIDAVHQALHDGYRHIDTAAAYENEGTVGKALASGDVSREDLFITTKVWNSDRGYDATLKAFEKSLDRLHLDYVDLYLIHWPAAEHRDANWKSTNADTWRALESLYLDGKVRAIGVSNFKPEHLEPLMDTAQILPMVDQIEFHPGYVQWETVEFCRASQILVEAWSPLGRQRLADDPLLAELAGKYGVSQAQICLRFALDCGVVPCQVGRRWTDAPEPGAGLCPGGGGLGAAADHAPDRLVRPAPGQVSRRDRREPVLPRACGEDGPFRIYSSDWYWAQTSSTKSQNRWTAGRTLRSLGRNI